MKKIVFGILIALIAVSPAAAAKKKKAAAPPASGMTYEQAQQANENSWRLFRDSLPVYLPTAAKVIMYPPGNNSK